MRIRILLSNTFLVGGGGVASSLFSSSSVSGSLLLFPLSLPRIDMDEEGREVREDRDERQTLCAPMVM